MKLMLLGLEEGTCPPIVHRRHCSEPMMHCSNETMMQTQQKHSRHVYHHHDESISFRSSSESLLIHNDDDFHNNATPPTIIYTRGASASQDEMDRDIENHTALKSCSIQPEYILQQQQEQQQQQQQQNNDGKMSSNNVSQGKLEVKIEQYMETGSGNKTMKDMQQPIIMDLNIHDEEEDENTPAPPHVKFNEDMSDDDNDEDEDTDDFHSIWIHN